MRRIQTGLNIDPSHPGGDAPLAKLQDLGVEWVRIGFKDTSGFVVYDPVVNQLHAAGIKILMILHYETEPGMPDKEAPDPEWDAYIDSFAARCGNIAQHFGLQVDAYQIWNEQDHPGEPGYKPGIRASVFGRMLAEASGVLRAPGVGTIIGGGSSAGSTTHYLDARNSLGGSLPVDAIAVHPYGRRPEDDWPRPDWGFGPIVPLIQTYRSALDLPVWVTEMGVKEDEAGSQGTQAVFLSKTFAALDGQAEVLHWFCYSDGMVPTFGLLEASGAEKPSYQSFKNLPPVIAPTPPSDWPARYFSPSEFDHPDRMDRNALILADLTREGYGKRLFVTSDWRPMGSVSDSLHPKGQAIDLIPLDEPFTRAFMWSINEAVVKAWMILGRPGWSIEFEPNEIQGQKHIHLGIAYDGRDSRLIPRG